MTLDSSGSRSIWMSGSEGLARAPLDRDARADVCIVGAGMAGMLIGHALASEGRRVVILDDGSIGSGESGRTTAHLSNAVDDRYYRIEQAHGKPAAEIVADSHTQAIAHLERVAREENIECDFRRLDGYLFLPPGESPDELTRELAAARRAGLSSVSLVDRAPSFDSGPCLRFPDQGQFHPLRFLAGLATAIERRGGAIYTGSHVTKFDHGRPLAVHTQAGAVVRANAVVVATNSPVNDLVTMHTKQAAYRTYALAARIPPGSVTPALYWDTSEKAGHKNGPYHYVRVTSSDAERDDILIVGGGDHLTGDPDEANARWAGLELWARERWPVMLDVVARWSGQVLEPFDMIAFIGRNPTGPDGVYIVTGDSGMGMTHSAIAAIMLPRLIAGESHPWKGLYDPSRKPVHALGEFATKTGRMALQYADWLTPGVDLDEIRPGEGRVVRRGVKLLAVYRDDRGALHPRSAVCTHLGCIVRWNHAERSWDCPCHGSRFNAFGKVLNGPALRDLPDRDVQDA